MLVIFDHAMVYRMNVHWRRKGRVAGILTHMQYASQVRIDFHDVLWHDDITSRDLAEFVGVFAALGALCQLTKKCFNH